MADPVVTGGMILIVMGVSGSGKSTVGRQLAERLGWRFLDADAYHSPANIEKMSRGEPLTEADRQDWLKALREEIEQQLAQDASAVLACSALTKAARHTLRVDRERVKFIYLKGSADLIRRRMAGRQHFMPPALLTSQFATLEPPTDAITVSIDQPIAAVIDAIVQQLR
ncbi:MAG: gluconokinase [Phycisphaeraceae bacterium]